MHLAFGWMLHKAECSCIKVPLCSDTHRPKKEVFGRKQTWDRWDYAFELALYFILGSISAVFDPNQDTRIAAMSVGIGAGDFVTIPTLCWKIYRACKDAPEEYRDLSNEVGSLHLVLLESKELVEHASGSARWKEGQVKRLEEIHKSCEEVLKDLDAIITHYQSLGTKLKRTWDRMKWGLEGVEGIRNRIVLNTTILSAFIASVSA